MSDVLYFTVCILLFPVVFAFRDIEHQPGQTWRTMAPRFFETVAGEIYCYQWFDVDMVRKNLPDYGKCHRLPD